MDWQNYPIRTEAQIMLGPDSPKLKPRLLSAMNEQSLTTCAIVAGPNSTCGPLAEA